MISRQICFAQHAFFVKPKIMLFEGLIVVSSSPGIDTSFLCGFMGPIICCFFLTFCRAKHNNMQWIEKLSLFLLFLCVWDVTVALKRGSFPLIFSKWRFVKKATKVTNYIWIFSKNLNFLMFEEISIVQSH